MRIKTIDFTLSAAGRAQFPDKDLPEIAFVGRSNVGKSSLLNMLVGRKGLARISNTPGKTQTINFFLVDEKFYVVDLPGYGYAKVSRTRRAEWGRLSASYLEGRPSLRLVCQLIDSRHAPTQSDRNVMQWLKDRQIPVLILLTKADKLNQKQTHNVKTEVETILAEMRWEVPLILTSSKKKTGRAAVWSWIGLHLK